MKHPRLRQATEINWEFEVIGDPPKRFVATSTAEFAAGEGHQVMYDVEESEYHGYGVDEWTDEQEGE